MGTQKANAHHSLLHTASGKESCKTLLINSCEEPAVPLLLHTSRSTRSEVTHAAHIRYPNCSARLIYCSFSELYLFTLLQRQKGIFPPSLPPCLPALISCPATPHEQNKFQLFSKQSFGVQTEVAQTQEGRKD